jgi:CheY-like chemotaxis protein
MRTLSLIVAEDDPFMREWLLTILQGLEARVQPVANGRELASLLAREGQIDLVISDIRMPGPSGLEVLAAARAKGSAVPFLFITGYGGPDVHAAAADLGATVLGKPFTARDLLARVRQLCSLGETPRGIAHETQRSNDAE